MSKEKDEADAKRKAETPPAPVPGNPSGQPATDKRGNEPQNAAAQKPAREVDSLNKPPHNPPYQGESAWHKQASDNINEGQDHKNPITPPASGHNVKNVPVGPADQDAPRTKEENDKIEAENARQADLHINPDGTKNVLVEKQVPRDTVTTHVAEKAKATEANNLLPVKLLKGYYPKDGSGKIERGKYAELPASEAREVVRKGLGERGDAF